MSALTAYLKERLYSRSLARSFLSSSVWTNTTDHHSFTLANMFISFSSVFCSGNSNVKLLLCAALCDQISALTSAIAQIGGGRDNCESEEVHVKFPFTGG